MTDSAREFVKPGDIPPELLKKYTQNAPRYTSYPTAPQFKERFDLEEIKAEWMKAGERASGLSVYVHIPFCRARCGYCGCFTETGHSSEFAETYAGSLLREAETASLLLGSFPPLKQFALGGGTPTFLPPQAMKTLVNGLKSRFKFSEDAEISIEVDPRSVDKSYLDVLIELGFNRFSFGVQDLNPEVQKAIGRIQSEESIISLVSHLKKSGINAINIDLISGLPLQTPESFEKTARKVAEIGPSRIALFGYAHVPWVSPHQKRLERRPIPNPDEKVAIFNAAFETFIEAGFLPVGMDHFALPDDELIQSLNARTLTRNFMGYTTRRGLDLIGLGASAISSVGAVYTQTTKDIHGYTQAEEFPLWFKALNTSEEDRIRRDIIIDLFCNFHLEFDGIEQKYDLRFAERFARELEELQEFEREGLLKLDGKSISLTGLGRYFVRNVCTVFDEYIKKEKEKRYSKTF